MISFKHFYLLLFTFFFININALPQDMVLRAEFIVNLGIKPNIVISDGNIDPSNIDNILDEYAIEALRQETNFIFGGMIWGFKYVYRPSDKARNIDEFFTTQSLNPFNELSIKPISLRVDKSFIYITAVYKPSHLEESSIKAWPLLGAPQQARASASLASAITSDSPIAAKLEAVKYAMRDAVRAYMRQKIHNKPREVSGLISFAQPPRFIFVNGAWTVQLRVYISYDKIIPFTVF